MKKIPINLLLVLCFIVLTTIFSGADVSATATSERLSGRILLQTEEQGQAWYVNPTDQKRYYLGRPQDAWNIMRALGLGITDANLARIATYNNNDWATDLSILRYVEGRILIQTELNGEAWYVSPVDDRRYYLGRPTDAFQLMRNLGLGISNQDLTQIPIGTVDTDTDTDTDTDSSDLISTSDLVYQGAFRLPTGSDGEEGPRTWSWGGSALTHYPAGDPSGPGDGYLGSLYGTGHEQTQYISEISIPRPVISTAKNFSDLNTATTLQEFRDIRTGFMGSEVELGRVGLAYLSQQGSQDAAKIHFGWGQHFQEEADTTHGWFDLNLSNPQQRGGWYIDDQSPYSTSDYLFAIPGAWASGHTPGQLLATGRYRDGGWSGQGPSLYAYGSWNDGNPPADGTRLAATTLLEYDSSYDRDALDDDTARTLNNYHHSDEWSGAAWLTKGSKSAVIFIGTKGGGDEYWYGDADGPCMECAGDRGWWSASFTGQILFYNPADLAAVAAGSKQPYEPQPYATLNIDPYLYHVSGRQQKYHLGAAAFDSVNEVLYVAEYLGDGEDSRPLMHVFAVN
ncbi:MAG: hypothetical protein ABII72_04020 [Parcubacteria group bacterium]